MNQRRPIPYRLSEILNEVRKVLQQSVGSNPIWIRAEIAKLTHHSNGHCYLELVEQQRNRPAARANAVIWASHLSLIRKSLDAEYSNILKQGVEMVCLCRITFHELYGFQIQITDVDPTFNLGAMELQKQQTLKKLIARGLIDKNRRVPSPLVMQRIALIASPTSAGIQDFIQQVEQNKFGYKIHVTVFPAVVQGESAPLSMLDAYQRIDPTQFDVVAIVRGGGSKLDLEPFNQYDLSATLAQCPIPVMTGIGHDVDHSVLDEVAFMMHKTPTALAAYIVDQVHEFEYGLLTTYLTIVKSTVGKVESGRQALAQAATKVESTTRELVQSQHQVLRLHTNHLAHTTRQALFEARSGLQQITHQLQSAARDRLTHREPANIKSIADTLQMHLQALVQHTTSRLQYMEKTVAMLHPQSTLNRGFSITRIDHQAVTTVDTIAVGDLLHTQVSDGIIISTVINKTKHHESTGDSDL